MMRDGKHSSGLSAGGRGCGRDGRRFRAHDARRAGGRTGCRTDRRAEGGQLRELVARWADRAE